MAVASSSLPRWSHLPFLVPSSSVGRSLCEAERQRDEILREASGGSGSRGERGSAVKPPDSWNRLVHSGRGAADARLGGRPLCRGLRPGRRRGRGGGACAAGSSGHGLFLCPTSLRPFVFFLGGRRGAAISGARQSQGLRFAPLLLRVGLNPDFGSCFYFLPVFL